MGGQWTFGKARFSVTFMILSLSELSEGENPARCLRGYSTHCRGVSRVAVEVGEM